MNVIVDGIEYWQPECQCKESGHICYIRPKAQIIKADLGKVLENLTIGAGSA